MMPVTEFCRLIDYRVDGFEEDQGPEPDKTNIFEETKQACAEHDHFDIYSKTWEDLTLSQKVRYK